MGNGEGGEGAGRQHAPRGWLGEGAGGGKGEGAGWEARARLGEGLPAADALVAHLGFPSGDGGGAGEGCGSEGGSGGSEGGGGGEGGDGDGRGGGGGGDGQTKRWAGRGGAERVSPTRMIASVSQKTRGACVSERVSGRFMTPHVHTNSLHAKQKPLCGLSSVPTLLLADATQVHGSCPLAPRR